MLYLEYRNKWPWAAAALCHVFIAACPLQLMQIEVSLLNSCNVIDTPYISYAAGAV